MSTRRQRQVHLPLGVCGRKNGPAELFEVSHDLLSFLFFVGGERAGKVQKCTDHWTFPSISDWRPCPHWTDGSARGDDKRGFVIGRVSFFRLADVLAAPAILPTLALEYEADATSMGAGADASILGMTVDGPIIALPLVCGLAFVAARLFFTQAVVTALVGRAAIDERTSPSSLYLGCYYSGGLVGCANIGEAFDEAGWFASVLAAGGAGCLAAWPGRKLVIRAVTAPPNAEFPLPLTLPPLTKNWSILA